MAYKELLKRAETLNAKIGAQAFDLTMILIQVFDDTDFRYANSDDEEKARDILDRLCESVCLTFVELRALVRRYPERSQWETGRIKSMNDALLDEERDRQQNERAERQAVRKHKPHNHEVIEEANQKAYQYQAEARKHRKELQLFKPLAAVFDKKADPWSRISPLLDQLIAIAQSETVTPPKAADKQKVAKAIRLLEKMK